MSENKNLQVFRTMQQELIRDHYNQYVVIADEKVFGYYSNYSDAFSAVIDKFPMGSFIIQKACEPEKNTFAFYSPIFK